ncbi:MAG: ParB/RepB/Spo0J family partition protein [Rhizobiaceae bacterium]|nr:MAG: ParB/RepB/Spo0J family partition protein [Rhizobiaceae bacterium]
MADDRHRGLGRGLSALIGDEPVAAPKPGEGQSKGVRSVPVAFLRPNRLQPRKTFAADELQDLANSIREKGVLLPILVRPVAGDAENFEIVAGERRWRAAQIAKLHEVPVVVRAMSDSESLELAIVENVQRADLNAVEEAAGYQELLGRFSYTQEQLAQDVGKSRSHIANTIRLLKLPDSVQAMIRDGRLTAGHARTLIGLSDAEARAKEIVESGLNVRQAEQRSKSKSGRLHKTAEKNADIRALESSLSNRLGLKVEIVDKVGKGGEIHIAYKTLEQLDDIIRHLNRSV